MRKTVLVIAGISSGFILSTGAAMAALSTGESSEPARSAVPPYIELDRTNEAGLTYGSGLGKLLEDMPDLIAAIGVDGTEGFVRATDLFGSTPSSPEEALSQDAGVGDQRIPLYAKDGERIMGSYVITPGVLTEYR